MTLFTKQVTLKLRGQPTGEYDSRGNPVYSSPQEQQVSAWYEPKESAEFTDAREQVVWGYWVYLQEGTPVDAVDKVVVEGTEYDVQGEPGRQPGGFITPGYVKLSVGRTTG